MGWDLEAMLCWPVEAESVRKGMSGKAGKEGLSFEKEQLQWDAFGWSHAQALPATPIPSMSGQVGTRKAKELGCILLVLSCKGTKPLCSASTAASPSQHLPHHPHEVPVPSSDTTSPIPLWSSSVTARGTRGLVRNPLVLCPPHPHPRNAYFVEV